MSGAASTVALPLPSTHRRTNSPAPCLALPEAATLPWSSHEISSRSPSLVPSAPNFSVPTAKHDNLWRPRLNRCELLPGASCNVAQSASSSTPNSRRRRLPRLPPVPSTLKRRTASLTSPQPSLNESYNVAHTLASLDKGRGGADGSWGTGNGGLDGGSSGGLGESAAHTGAAALVLTYLAAFF